MSQELYHSQVQQTAFHARAAAACRTNEWGRWAGFTTVTCYDNVELEYFAIRNSTTLFDLSPMMKYRVSGKDAEAYLNRLVTRDVGKLKPGRVAYVVWCDEAGHVLDDGTLFRFSRTDFRLCAQERHLVWLTASALGFDVVVEDVSEEVAALALQGPTSCAVLKNLGFEGIENLRPFGLEERAFGGGKLTISRTGFTGDLGYEIWLPPTLAEPLWDALMAAGHDHDIRPIGSAALDLARIEAGFIAANVDFMAADQVVRRNRGRSPLELGLAWLVDFEKGHFNGRRALLREAKEGSRTLLVGLDIEGNKPANGALVYYNKRREVGHITSAMWSPTAKKNIALAVIKNPYGATITDNLWVEIYVLKELKWDKLMARCRLVERPFYDPPRRKAVPALDF